MATRGGADPHFAVSGRASPQAHLGQDTPQQSDDCAIKSYFPQVLQWFPDIRTNLVCDFLLRWPSLSALRRVRRVTLESFFLEHNSVRRKTLERRIKAIKERVPLVTDRAVLTSSVLMVKALAAQMKTTIAAITEFDAEIKQLCAQHQDFDIFTSLPGAGSVYASRLLAELGTDRQRWRSAAEVACYSGIAPVMERSGQSTWVSWRYFCPKFLRQTFHEYAGESIRLSFWARAYYQSQRAKGKSHQAEALIEMHTMELNRLSSGVPTTEVRDSIESVISHLEDQIKRTEKLIQKHINNHLQLKAERDLLLSIPGLGEATIARLDERDQLPPI